MDAKPFVLFSWQKPFLPALRRYIEQRTSGHPEHSVLIIPSSRPWRYLVDGYRKEGFHGLLPKVITLEETVRAWFLANAIPLLPYAGPLDTIPLLFRVLGDLAKSGEKALADMPWTTSLARFWPVGRQLASLLDDIYLQGKTPLDMQCSETPLPHLQSLLQTLGKIHKGYRKELEAIQHSTKALDFWRAANEAKTIPELLRPGPKRIVVLAGFSFPDGAEERLMKRLWEEGAELCLHTDSNLASPSASSHHAALCHSRWLARWKAKAVLYTDEGEATATPKLHFFAGYDAHSEIGALRRDLLQQKRHEASAILLLSPELLLPVLHHLPDKSVNISLGYPFTRTLLGQFFTLTLTLLAGAESVGCTSHDVLHFLQHPYVRQAFQKQAGIPLHACTQDAEEPFAAFATMLLAGNPLVSIEKLLAEYCGSSAEKAFLTELFATCLTTPARATTLQAFAKALEGMLTFLGLDQRDTPEESPLEQETVARFLQIIVPALTENAMSTEVISSGLQRLIFQQLLEERIPFEADPLTGIQLLGLAETPLLHFPHIAVLDCTDDILPGQPAPDFFLPDTLRPALGLPDAETRAMRSEYALIRLCMSARSVHFYWQEGTTKSGTSKKIRSRYIEQLLWQEEQKLGHILGPNEPPMESARASFMAFQPTRRSLKTTKAVEICRENLLRYPLSATFLDSYLACPARFFRERLLKLASLDTGPEQDAALIIGRHVHAILENVLQPFLGKSLHPGCVDTQTLLAAIKKECTDKEIDSLSPLSRYMLQTATERLLGSYLQSLPETTLLTLEQKITREPYPFDGRSLRLFGIVDRIDCRDDELLILDYKTGSLALPDNALWSDTALFEDIETCIKEKRPFDEANALLARLRPLLLSVQLPFYILLTEEYCQKTWNKPVGNACLIQLAKEGKEAMLFRKDLPPLKKRHRFARDIVHILLYTLLHAQSFDPEPGPQCDYCPYCGLCLL